VSRVSLNLYIKTIFFAKTGSGQTQGNTQTEKRFIYKSGEQVSHLREMFGFLPDPASDLLEEIGAETQVFGR
jgi:hypothetical protein